MTANNEIRLDARDHPIVDVTVYQSHRATVQRRFSLSVKNGQNNIVIKYLPSLLDDESIRVEAETTNYSQILTVFDVVYTDHPGVVRTSGTRGPVSPQVKALKNDKDALEMRLALLERHQMLLNGYIDNLRDGRIANATNESIMSFMDMSLEKQTQLWKERKKLEDDIEALTHNILEIGDPDINLPPMLQSGTTVVLLAEEAGLIELFLSYSVRNASWFSLYDLRADLSRATASGKATDVGGPRVQLHYRASIKQSTGEDWKNVPLTLSTASPLLGSEVPETQPWRIAAWKPPKEPSPDCDDPSALMLGEGLAATCGVPGDRDLMDVILGRRRRSRSRSRSRDLYIDRAESRYRSGTRSRERDRHLLWGHRMSSNRIDDLAPGEAVMSDAIPNVHISDGGISATFTVDGFSNIPSDGTSHKVSIANIDYDTELEWVTTPRRLPSAFLQCRIKNQSPYQLIAGKSSVFLDGKFVAKSFVPNVSPSEFFTCSLGVDPSVRINFHPQTKLSTTTGGTGLSSFLAASNPKMTVTAYSQRITIKNTRASTVIAKLIVRDRVPVSEDANIKVTLLQPSEGALGPVTGLIAKEANTSASAKGQQAVDHISKNVIARWAQKEENGGGSGGARGDGVIEWIVSDLKDSLDLLLAFEVTHPSDIRVVDAK
ncbi:hypothetical protein DL93DRAFT_2164756 [Clavulina sp. PMI_390]|nr:hypothetical protein DL93DRAFT_2164756 [Clavulina sp. PMI_390]